MSWYSSRFNHRLAANVPNGPGVYAYVQVERRHGLPKSINHFYIGKSNNLRRRFVDHTLRKEQNPIFHRVKGKENLEFWWRALPAHEIDEVEKQLIFDLKPEGNRIGK